MDERQLVCSPRSWSAGKLVCRAGVSEAEDDINHQLRMFWDVDTFGIRVDEAPITVTMSRGRWGS